MSVERISLDSHFPDQPEIERVARALADGALVAFPTETVYGLAASAEDPNAVERLQAVKGDRQAKPFTVHIGRSSDCEEFVPEIGPLGRRFIRKGWPGPLTLIFPVPDPRSARAHRRLSPAGAAAIYAEQSVGIRYPDHPVAEALLNAAGVPIIATSANVSGAPAPTEPGVVAAALGDRVDVILEAGPTRYRKSSTVVALNGEGYRLVRAGVWDERTVLRLSTVNILFVCTGNTCRSPIAEGVCKRMLAERFGCAVEELPRHGVLVGSAGTAGSSGGRVSPEAVEVCRKHDINISEHTSRGLTAEFLNPADYIFAMARHHLDSIRSIAPAVAGKAVLLDPAGDIPDPIGGGIEEYTAVAERITRALEERLKNEVVI